MKICGGEKRKENHTEWRKEDGKRQMALSTPVNWPRHELPRHQQEKRRKTMRRKGKKRTREQTLVGMVTLFVLPRGHRLAYSGKGKGERE